MIDKSTLNQKQLKRYNRIVSIAEELMYQQGFYKLSLTELTQKLKVSRSTIYEYFDSKEGLVEVVVDTLTERLNTTLELILQSDGLSTYEKFIHLAQEQSQNLNANCYRLLNDLKIHTPQIFQKFEAGRKLREQNGYQRLVEEGVAEGLFDPSLNQDFLVQLYLKMGQLISDTDLLENVSMNKAEAMQTIIKIYINGAQKMERNED